MTRNIYNTKGYLIEYMYKAEDNSNVHSIRHFKTYTSFCKFLKSCLDSNYYWIKRIYKVELYE